MELTLYQIDAFTDQVFKGNPAAVCALDKWLNDDVLQAIAQENNLSETVFFVSTKVGFEIRWFTPLVEVDFCGHATLAAAFVLFECLDYQQPKIVFESKAGELFVSKEGDYFKMDFPRLKLKPYSLANDLLTAIAIQPKEILLDDNIVLVLESEQAVKDYQPNFEKLKLLPGNGLNITAEGDQCDFVSRYFAPKAGINEDPVTGSAHCALAPYWSDKLNKNSLKARQVSDRGGDVLCEVNESHVILRGQAVKYMQATINI